MKIFAIIFSFYLIALTLSPCDDKPGMKELAGMSIISEMHNHSTDTCSPLCSCQCCQAQVNLSTCSGLSFYKEMVVTHPYYLLNYPNGLPSGFLIPPEIS